MRRFATTAVAALLLSIVAAPAAAPANPPGTGRPSVECGENGLTAAPPGFSTPGFANAEDHYSPVSQYDVACFQQTAAGH